jgi:type VI secretion system secreted protein VgrG
VLGSQTAIVVGPAGEEIYTDKYGRVKVQFHWDREGVYDDKSSCWIRVSHGSAGGGYGMLFLPRIGQEVIVDFLEGDPDRPIITGRVYNADQMPAYPLPDEKTRSYIKSNSSKGGGGTNEIRFEDKKDSEQILIYAQKDFHLNVQEKRIKQIGKDEHETVGGTRFVSIGDKYHLKVKTDWNQQVDGNVSVKVKGDVGEEVSGNQSLKVDGNLYIKAGQNLVLEATQGLTIKVGSNFMKIDPTSLTMIGMPKMNLNSGGSPGQGSPVTLAAAESPEEADGAEPGQDVTYNAQAAEYEALQVSQMKDEEEQTEAQEEDSWVEIELVDDEGQPCPFEPYELVLPNGRKTRGRLDKFGLARVDGIPPGPIDMTFPNLDKEGWRR